MRNNVGDLRWGWIALERCTRNDLILQCVGDGRLYYHHYHQPSLWSAASRLQRKHLLDVWKSRRKDVWTKLSDSWDFNQLRKYCFFMAKADERTSQLYWAIYGDSTQRKTYCTDVGKADGRYGLLRCLVYMIFCHKKSPKLARALVLVREARQTRNFSDVICAARRSPDPFLFAKKNILHMRES